MKRIVIFDLDETVIDSNHRVPNNPDGTLNLQKYFELKNRESIFKDSLLPLAKFMKNLDRKENYVVICTARQMSQDDYDYLESNGIEFNSIMCRKADGSENHKKDASMKAAKIKRLMNLRQFKGKPVYMFDDAKSVINAIRQLGIVCLNSHKVNRRLKAE